MTTTQILANKLNGCEYGDDTITDNEHYAEENGLIILTGYSDDNIETYGAFRDEVPAYNGTEFAMNEYEVLTECESPCDHCSQESFMENAPAQVTAQWNFEDYSWYIDVDGPGVKEKAYFDVLEDGEKFCRGVVVKL